ncbi:MAG: glutamine--tRNA ligase/YqeY domain fusion protein [Clostridiales Family XIII bacterium]|jgi:glutaminyl-tRNA synthetase|nr:glutamine--tRNA ligase/YqeY domain fusion protein [Clostridiales Family XIII bacterium]
MTQEQNNFIHNFIEEDLESGRYADRAICTRFPPEPNGYLHIGHAKAICLNFTTARKYGGKCNLRFDDTNPVKEDTEYVESIEEDVRWLGFEWAGLYFASDYFEKMYECAEELIRRGKAFVDDLSAEEIKGTRGTLTEPGALSPYRDRSPEENLRLFRGMREGEYADGEKVLRAKIDMAAPNINLRDPVIYRISKSEHHNTGGKWCVYPMYDYAHPLEDAIEEITHSLCTMEFEDHRPLYDWVLEALEWPAPPRQIEFARLNLTHTLMSKRALKALVDAGAVDGWDDPRMPTIAGIRRRGYTPEAVRAFCEEIGVAKANSTVDIGFLEHCVREDLKDKVLSRNVVFDPIKVVLTNYPENGPGGDGSEEMIMNTLDSRIRGNDSAGGGPEEMIMENSREVPELGERRVPFSRELWIDGEDFMEEPPKKYFRLYPGNEVRLKGAYFITCEEVVKNADGSIRELRCTYDPATRSGSGFEGRKVKGTIHWVDAATALPITVREYGYLMDGGGDGGGEDGEGGGAPALNKDSLCVKTCYAEPSLSDARPGERFQFFRHGYYIADGKLTSVAPDGEKVFNLIVGLKSSWKIK